MSLYFLKMKVVATGGGEITIVISTITMIIIVTIII